MNYEEKYKEALERARNLHKDAIDMGENLRAKQCEIIFPELVESEDERVRKWLITQLELKSDVNNPHDLELMILKSIAWLERQGKQKQLYIRFGEIPTDEKSKIYRGEIEVGTENGVSVYPAFKTDEGDIVLGLSLPITKTTLYTQQHLIEYDNRPCYLVNGDYIGKDTDGQPLINNVSIIKKIDSYRVKEENQNEQKFEMKTAEESLGIDSDTYNKIVDECLFGEQKFTEFERGLFDMLTDISNPCTADCVKLHSEKLLSIARKMIALEQKPIEQQIYWTEEEIEPIISDYLCGREHYGGMIGRLCHLKPKQKQTEWSENDKAFLDDILCKLEHDLILNKDEKDWLKSLRPQSKQEWSEEDEVKINRIVACLENLNVADNDILCKDVDWLKSLKLQPKQSLDEDTQQWIDTIIKDYEDLYNTDKDHRATIQAKISILKSLRPQNRWKPSDEQIGLLQAIINEPNNAASESCQIVLKDILEQLKKLKEE